MREEKAFQTASSGMMGSNIDGNDIGRLEEDFTHQRNIGREGKDSMAE